MTSILGSSGKATAALEVTVADLLLVKSFTDDPVPPGNAVTLEFTILNRDRNEAASSINEVDKVSQNTDAAANELLAAAVNLSDQAERLSDQVEAFLGEVRAA